MAPWSVFGERQPILVLELILLVVVFIKLFGFSFVLVGRWIVLGRHLLFFDRRLFGGSGFFGGSSVFGRRSLFGGSGLFGGSSFFGRRSYESGTPAICKLHKTSNHLSSLLT